MPRKTKKTLSVEEEIKNLLVDLLEKLKVKAEIIVTKEIDDHYKANIQTQETGLLIGRHGETLNGLQLILGVILYKKLGSWTRVVLDVGGYRQAREESIKEMANRMAAEVESLGQPVTMPFLTPLERRVVHMTLASHPKVVSESMGEGKDRRVIIKLR